MNEFFDKCLQQGYMMLSSGSTGPQKKLWQSAEKIKEANRVAREVQKIQTTSRIYTVCKIDHAGGLLAQSLPAHEIGASVEVEDFNHIRWCERIGEFTHSHLTPKMARVIAKSKQWKDLDLTGKTITCGSDKVPAETINKFTAKGATFIANWGMTEIGPIVINKTYVPGSVAEDFEGHTVMGDVCYCNWRISEDNELWVKSDTCIYRGWFPTGDLVKVHGVTMYYMGRKDA